MQSLEDLIAEIAVGTSKKISPSQVGLTRDQFTARVQQLQDGGLPEGYRIEFAHEPRDGSGSIDLIAVRRLR